MALKGLTKNFSTTPEKEINGMKWQRHSSEVFYKDVLKTFATFTRKYLCPSLFFEETLAQVFFLWILWNFLRTPFFTELFRWFLLKWVKFIYISSEIWLSANPTKWSNTLKQFVGKLPTNCLSVFDHFVGLALKGLRWSDTEQNSVQKWLSTLRISDDTYNCSSKIGLIKINFYL